MHKIVSETIAGAILLSAAQCAFVNQMLKSIVHTAPEVEPAKLIVTGVSEIRDVFPPEQIPGILLAYMDGLRIPFAIATATAGAAFILACIVLVLPNRTGKTATAAGLESSSASEATKEEPSSSN